MRFLDSLKNYFKFSLIPNYCFRAALFVIQYALYHPKHFKTKNIKKVLIVRQHHLGDLLLALPTIYSLRSFFPKAQFHLVIGSWNRELAQEFVNLFDTISFYNVNSYCRNRNQKMSVIEKAKILLGLMKQKFDLCIDFDGSFGFLIVYLAKKIKYLSSIEAIRFFQNLEQLGLTKSNFKYNIYRTHEVDNLASVLQMLQIEDKTKDFSFPFNPKASEFVEHFFNQNSLTSPNIIVGIHPTASQNKKMWNASCFAKLADYFSENFKCKILFFGSKEDNAIIFSIQNLMKEISVNGSTLRIAEFIEAVKRCDLLICLDSFSQHVAFLQRIPLAVIYVDSYIAQCAPYGDDDRYSVIKKSNLSDEIYVADVLAGIPKIFTEKLNH